MSTDIVYSAIRDHLVANWSATPLEWENETFVEPVDADGRVLPWVEVELSGNIYDQASLGAGDRSQELWREEGLLWLHVHVAAGSSSLLARHYATQLGDLFRGLDLAPAIEFRSLSIGLGEPGTRNGKCWTLSLSIEWLRG